MLIDFFIICKRQIYAQFQFSLKKKNILSEDSYKAKVVHYKSGKYISNIRLYILKLKLWYLLLLRKSCVK